MNRLLMTAVAVMFLVLPAAARADDDLLKQRQAIDALEHTQLDMVEKFKENKEEAEADKARYNALEKETKRQEREHATLEAQRAQVKKECVGIIPEGTLIEATNSCNAINAPFQQNIAIHNAAIAKTANDYKDLEAKEKKRAAAAEKLQSEDIDQKSQLYGMKRKLLIGIKNACIPTCSEQSPNRVNGCIQGCWERARLKGQLPLLPGEKPVKQTDVSGAPTEPAAPPAPPPPPPDPGDPLAGAPRQPQ